MTKGYAVEYQKYKLFNGNKTREEAIFIRSSLAGLRLPDAGPMLYPKGHGLHRASCETDADTQAPHLSCCNVPESADKWDPK